ncbi:MAG: ABC transporter substrate-binding protein [Clostridiales bacterium]|nr:ABC transporter substrate-binding protein [Clostridiales bacterium]
MRRLALTALLIMVALVVGACGSPGGTGSSTPTNDKPFAGQTLVVTSYGGTWQEFMEKEIVPDFEAQTGAKIQLAVGLSKDWIAQLRAAGVNNPPYDVVIANETWISRARAEGYFQKLPVEKIPNLNDVHPKLRMPNDVGVLALIGPLGLGYRTDLVQNPPTSWLDIRNYDGKAGIYNIVNAAAAQQVMMTAKILTGDYKDWKAGAEWIKASCPLKQTDFSGDMEQLLLQGEIVVGIIDAPAASRLKKQGAPIEWVAPKEGLFMFEQNVNVTAGTKVPDLAFAFVNYMLSEPVQQKWAQAYYWTPANVKVIIPDDLKPYIPIQADNIGLISQWDWEWFHSGPDEELVNWWNREMTGSCR